MILYFHSNINEWLKSLLVYDAVKTGEVSHVSEEPAGSILRVKKYSRLQFTKPRGIIRHNISICKLSALLSSLIASSRYNLGLQYLVAWRAVAQDMQ